MANDCCGIMKVVAKNPDSIKRLMSIMKYEDPEYFCYRVRDVGVQGNIPLDKAIEKDGDLYVCDFETDAAWQSGPWFDGTDDPGRLVVTGYGKGMKEIYGTAHLISIDRLCKKLGLAVELYATEPGCSFCEHYLVNHVGDVIISDIADYELVFPDGEDGEPDYDQEPKEETDMDLWNFASPSEIYYGE